MAKNQQSVQVRLDPKGVAALLKSSEVKGDMEARARRVAKAAGAGHSATSWVGFDRARATVSADTYRARKLQAQNNNLLRALDAAR